MSMIDEAANASRESFFNEVLVKDPHMMTGEQLKVARYGVPLPYFSQRFMFWSNVIPAGVSVLFAGMTGACKTSMAMDFSRLFIENCGVAVGIHTEQKWPDLLVNGLFKEHIKYFANIQAGTLQEWQTCVRDMFEGGILKRENGHRISFALFVDSVAGGQGAETDKRIREKGVAGRNFSEIARELTDWLRTFKDWLAATSGNAFFIYHLKKKDKQWYAPGGDAKDFYASHVFFMDRAKQETRFDQSGSTAFRVTCKKNSHGPMGMQFDSRMMWAYDPETGEPDFRFMWPETTASMVDGWMKDTKKVAGNHPFRKLMKGYETRVGQYGQTRYTFPRIKADALYAREFGEAIEANLEFRRDLDAAFHIPQRPSTSEFFKVVDERAAAAEEAKKKGGRRKKKAGPTPKVEPTPPAKDS